MAESGPQVPDASAPPAPQAPQQLVQQVQQVQQIQHLNWSHCKPEFSGKLEEDAEAHLAQIK